ncbi:hypothetical protein EGW08_018514 [Elysia chlorotica]|uniref:PDZ domain-containing protein n=1 Tax=Elysia chlorotica TaxID=188477 RepID=A0A433SWT2_ELYCH|nr:hypothetical protein EGW08_018514 [Elysia chlorotica]
MPLRLLHKWPKSFGFEIYGNGPSYVISVQKGSMAEKSGLRPGDQLLELNGCDVTAMSPNQIRALAKPRAYKPPDIKVVSCLQTVEISPELPVGYGFSVAGEGPVTVGSVDYGGAAFRAGLRTGDVILEVTGKSTVKLSAMAAILSQLPGPLVLLTIPVGRLANLIHVDKEMAASKWPNPRLYTARDLYRKVLVFSERLWVRDRSLMRTSYTFFIFSLLIPPAQREAFDDHMTSKAFDDHMTSKAFDDHMTSKAFDDHMTSKALIQIVRESDSFGFVVKSCSPALIASVDVGGPAHRAGLEDGDVLLKLNGLDVRRTPHDRLVQLLQESGSAPILEVWRGPGEQDTRRSSSPSSVSSHDSDDHLLFGNTLDDSEGNVFSEKVSYLLTPRERRTMKGALREYERDRNVVVLFTALSAILDTPSRQTLWPFVLVLMPTPHREYVAHRVALPQVSVKDKSLVEPNVDTGRHDKFPASFHQQLNFLLTASERQHFMQSLQQYDQSQDLDGLVQSLEAILDSPSKRVLWRLVLPRLTSGHRDHVEHRLDLQEYSTGLAGSPRPLPVGVTAMDSYIGEPEDFLQTQRPPSPESEQRVLFGTDNNPDKSHESDSSENGGNSSDDSSAGSEVETEEKSLQVQVRFSVFKVSLVSVGEILYLEQFNSYKNLWS